MYSKVVSRPDWLWCVTRTRQFGTMQSPCISLHFQLKTPFVVISAVISTAETPKFPFHLHSRKTPPKRHRKEKMATEQNLDLKHVTTRKWVVIRDGNVLHTKCFMTNCPLPPYRLAGKKCGRHTKNSALCERHFIRTRGCLCNDGQHRNDDEPPFVRGYSKINVTLPPTTRTESDDEKMITSSGRVDLTGPDVPEQGLKDHKSRKHINKLKNDVLRVDERVKVLERIGSNPNLRQLTELDSGIIESLKTIDFEKLDSLLSLDYDKLTLLCSLSEERLSALKKVDLAKLTTTKMTTPIATTSAGAEDDAIEPPRKRRQRTLSSSSSELDDPADDTHPRTTTSNLDGLDSDLSE